MSRWLVTGGAGFIGSHIVEKLVSMKEKVRVLDNLTTGDKAHLAGVIKDIEFIKGDIRDKKDVAKAVKNVDYVLHEAAFRSVPRSVAEPEECTDINVTGILNCLLAARDAKVKRFVFAASSSIYGNTNVFPQKETHLPMPISPYAVTKGTGEFFCRTFSETYGLSAVALRYFNVFGPRQDPRSRYAAVIPKFIIEALKGVPLEVHWDGKQARDFTYVSNVVHANILAATTKKLTSPVYNVACGSSISLLEIIALVEKFMGKPLKKKFQPKREGDVRKTWGDGSLIAKDMKYKLPVDFEEGLKYTFEFFAENDRWKKY